ncbi:ROK family transcriptional regulator [Microbacterium hydrocarbonoxydans]|uniref:ROK family transcriptional regulator n=1 Tax=Microbacterium hydrocarbonoxydans TaxID=273678 RepID=UPI0007BC0005|nr:ROK family transcriptional regulator [Microbacterium hydrocarbonoxydans]GAT72712.1 ROK-family protein [Microbacterium sp. HM58-2]
MSQIDPGTSSWLRTRNDREALRLLLEHGPLTRTRLGELSGMSKPTATQMLARLEKAELVAPVGEASGSRGPSAVTWGVRGDRVTGVAVSMTDDGLQAVLVDAVGTEHPIVELAAPGLRSPEGDVRRAIEAACAAAGEDRRRVEAVTVGVQAAVSGAHDLLSLTDSLPGWPSTGARARIESALGVTATLENDVNLATMAERAFGVAQDADCFALLWLGVGLGVGVDIGGVIHRGAHGGAGEIGYLAVAAGAGVPAAVTTALLGADAVVSLSGDDRHPADLDGLDADAAVLGVLADRVALTLEPVLAVLDPDLVVLGGPTALAAGGALAELVGARIGGAERPAAEVRLSGTGHSAVLAGARSLLVEQIRSRLEDRIPTQ